MSLNFDLGGKTYPASTVSVTAEQIAGYARASGDDNPLHAIGPDQIGSPVFPVVYGLPALAAVTLDPELGVDNPLMILHGEQRIVHHRPVRPGDSLVLTPSLETVEDKGRNAVFTARLSASTESGEPVNDQYATIFVRGGGSGAERASSSEHPTRERGNPTATVTSHVDVDMPRRYADASGDHNPVHLDAAVAAAVGLPGVINHGMGTLSLVVGGIVAAALEGAAASVTEVSARMTDMVVPGTDLVTQIWEGDGSLEFETIRPGGAVAMVGTIGVA